MSKYQKLDASILEAINDSSKKFASIDAGAVCIESECIAKDEAKPRTRGEVVAWRMVDRRLQALRMAGKICSTTKGWVRT
ncbi:hypothetical protein [Burkholderia cepacia]|uniref:hypothetical protein n=1 Tax=Burkholderia cepacia TaxID=292 RepID=UPI00398EB303